MKTTVGLFALVTAVIGWFGIGEDPASVAAQAQPCAVVSQTPRPTVAEAAILKLPFPSGEPEAETVPETAAPPETPEPEPTSTPWPTLRAVTIADDGLKNFTSHTVDTQALMAEGCALSLPAAGPQILIVHTHACEAYTAEPGKEYESAGDWRTLDEEQNVVAVGAALKGALEAQGLRVLHDTQLYDWPDYNSAYVNSGAGIEGWLAAYPDIAMVIDLHRDALGEEECIYKTVTDAAEPMAQLMFVVGSDQNLCHQNWQENLKLALLLQQTAQEHCPTLMRPIDLSACRYNQQLTTGSLILEVGTCGNTLAEAIAAAECFAEAVGPTLAAMVKA